MSMRTGASEDTVSNNSDIMVYWCLGQGILNLTNCTAKISHQVQECPKWHFKQLVSGLDD